MRSALRLLGIGSLFALGVLACSSTPTPTGEDGGKTDSGKTDSATDGAKTDGSQKTDAASNDAKDAAVKDAGGLDLSGVAPPAMLTATVSDRRATTFELVWAAPSNNGAAVAGYQVRYAKVPITTANFDDTAITTAVTYTGTPKAPGETDGTIAKAYIENGYYFAVTGTDSAGAHVGTFMATTAAVAAHFNATQIASTSGMNEEFGFSVSGDGDLNGDGLSDILVGTLQGGKAYLFFGSTTFAVGAAAVTFSGAGAGFGFAVAQIGDVDHDGLPDIAISDPTNALKVYIYKGRHTWPMTLTDAQADYVISTDASYAASAFGFSLARLGDFTGDGIDDFAIGARAFGTGVGRVVIIPGKTAGFASVALPDPTNAIVIDGDATLGEPFFGYRVLGLGHFYSVSTGTTLIASGDGSSTSTPANAGHVYAFHGQTGAAGAISIASADKVLSGAANADHVGIVLSNLGAILNGSPSVGVGNPVDTTDIAGGHGGGYVMSGTPTTGPFASALVVYLTGSGANGGVMLGGGVSGLDVTLSLIGDGTPDLVFGGETGPTLTISDGARLREKVGPIDLGSAAEVSVTLPTNWNSAEAAASVIPDLNGDGYADFCLGSQIQPGAILIYW